MTRDRTSLVLRAAITYLNHGTWNPQKTPRRTEDRIEMKKTTHLPWHALTADEQDREYSPYALYVSLDEYLTLREYQ